MTYLQIYNLRYSNQTLQAKVAVACVKAAQDILNEAPNAVDHAKRVVWANSALVDSGEMANRIMWGVVSNATVQTNGDATSDSDIQWVVNGLIPVFMNGV